MKPNLSVAIIDRENRQYPKLLIKRLGKDAPDRENDNSNQINCF